MRILRIVFGYRRATLSAIKPAVFSHVPDLCAPLPRRNGLFRRRGKASPNKRPGQKLAMKYFDRAGRFRGAHKSRTWCFLGVFDGRGTHKSGTCPHAGGGNPACFSPRSAHYAIEGSRIRHRQKDFLLTPHGILRVPASRGLPALASRAREFYSPLDCRMLALAQDDRARAALARDDETGQEKAAPPRYLPGTPLLRASATGRAQEARFFFGL